MDSIRSGLPWEIHEPEVFGSYADIRQEMQTQDPNNSDFYAFMRPELRRLDALSFDSLYANSFGQEPANRGIYNSFVEVSGAVTDARKNAVSDIIKYMESNNILETGAIDSIHFDRSLPDGVLGRTVSSGYYDDVRVSYLPKIFDRSYKDARDPVMRDAIKYIQARTLKHERVHEEMLSGPDAYRAQSNLEKMNYSEDVFKGLLEGMAEFETEKSFYDAGEKIFGDKVHNESPYKDQLRIVGRIEKEFEYTAGKRAYRGVEGFYEALVNGVLDKKTADDFLEGIELKSDSMPTYKAFVDCDKCGYGNFANCGTSKYA